MKLRIGGVVVGFLSFSCSLAAQTSGSNPAAVAEKEVTMHREAYASILALICLALVFLPSCTSSLKPPPVTAITATSGTPQNAVVDAAFALTLQATVTSGGSPASGMTVTFTAPASGASGTFASNGTAT